MPTTLNPDDLSKPINPAYNVSLVLQSQEKYGRNFDTVLQRPDPIHFAITRLLEFILDVCEKARIDVWLDAGTLLGHKRDGGVILWDYDGDLCCWAADRERLSAAFAATPSPADFPVVVDENGYQDPTGCWWIMSGLPDIVNPGVDIIFYKLDEDSGMVVNQMAPHITADSPCAFDYRFPMDMVLPMTRELFLGRRALVFHDWDRYLTATYSVYGSWRVPVKDPAKWIVPRFHGPATVPVTEYNDVHDVAKLLEIREAHVASDTPFILRNTRLLHKEPEDLDRLVNLQTTPVTIYRPKDNIHGTGLVAPSTTGVSETDGSRNMPLKQVFALLREGKLEAKVLDAAVDAYDQVFPAEWLKAACLHMGSEAVMAANALCWHVVQDGNSEWHMDAIDNDHAKTHLRPHEQPYSPGGFVRLLAGDKTWWFLPKSAWSKLLDPSTTSPVAIAMRELFDFNTDPAKAAEVYSKNMSFSIGEILQHEPEITWGQVRTVAHRAGDLLWFPAGCLHRVATFEPSYGLGGYL